MRGACQRILGFVVVAVLFFSGSAPVLAQSAGTNALSVSPAKSTIDANPGDKQQLVITVKNLDSVQADFAPVFDNFKASADESGQPAITTDATYANGIESWLSGDGSFTLDSQASAGYTVNIAVPAGTPAGTYYGIVFFKKTTADAAQNPSAGSLIFVNVGKISQSVAVESFTTSELATDPAGDVTGSLVARIKNNANGFTTPTLTIELSDSSGQAVATLDANPASGGILPGTIRKYSVALPTDKLQAGKSYHAKLIAGDAGNQPLTATKDFTTPQVPGSQAPLPAKPKKSRYTVYLITGAAVGLIAVLSAVTLIRRRGRGSTPQPPAGPAAQGGVNPPPAPVITPAESQNQPPGGQQNGISS